MALSPNVRRTLPIALANVPAATELMNAVDTLTGATGGVPGAQYKTNSATTSVTGSSGDIEGAGDCVLDMTGTLAAGRTYTTRTAAQILANLPNAIVGTSWKVRIINDSSGNFAWTIAGGSGVTVAAGPNSGVLTIADSTWREFLMTVTNVATPAISMQAVGTGTQS
jgi:hypothetical protein